MSDVSTNDKRSARPPAEEALEVALSLLVPALRIFRVFRLFRLFRLARVGRGLRLFRVVTSMNRGMRPRSTPRWPRAVSTGPRAAP